MSVITAEAAQLVFLVLPPDLDAFLVAICMHSVFTACLKHTSPVIYRSKAYVLRTASKHASLEKTLPELFYRTKTSLQSVCQHLQPVHASKIRVRQETPATTSIKQKALSP